MTCRLDLKGRFMGIPSSKRKFFRTHRVVMWKVFETKGLAIMVLFFLICPSVKLVNRLVVHDLNRMHK